MNPRRKTRKELFTLLYKFFFTKDALNRLRRRGSLREPVLRALCVDLHLNRIRERVVLSDYLQKTAVSGAPFIDDDDPVKGPFFRPDPGQTHCYQTVSLLDFRKTKKVYPKTAFPAASFPSAACQGTSFSCPSSSFESAHIVLRAD